MQKSRDSKPKVIYPKVLNVIATQGFYSEYNVAFSEEESLKMKKEYEQKGYKVTITE